MKFCIYQLDIVGEGYTAPGAVRGEGGAADVMSSWSWTRRGGDTRQTARTRRAHGDMRTLRLIRYSPSICVRLRRCQGPCCAVLHCDVYTPQLPLVVSSIPAAQ